jgi:hypothetical protein
MACQSSTIVSSACECGISLPIELPLKGVLNSSGFIRLLPVLGPFYFHNKDSSKGEACEAPGP